jgi:uncharacterized protein YjiS (DUF1127 family)
MKTMYGSMGAQASLDRRFGTRSGLGHVLRVALTRIAETVLLWQERAFQRHALESLDERALRDMGMSRADVAREAGKPFWRA